MVKLWLRLIDLDFVQRGSDHTFIHRHLLRLNLERLFHQKISFGLEIAPLDWRAASVSEVRLIHFPQGLSCLSCLPSLRASLASAWASMSLGQILLLLCLDEVDIVSQIFALANHITLDFKRGDVLDLTLHIRVTMSWRLPVLLVHDRLELLELLKLHELLDIFLKTHFAVGYF